jgi:hypothetical protein
MGTGKPYCFRKDTKNENIPRDKTQPKTSILTIRLANIVITRDKIEINT